MRKSGLIVTTLAVGAWLAGAGLASATLDIQKKAKAEGFPATNCGKFLVDMKAKKNAKEIDVSWLKEYVEKK